MLQWLLLIHLIVGGVTLVVYGLDKLAAIRHRRRVPEATLHMLALLGGVGGAVAGQWLFRHKVRKTSFMVVTLVIALLHVALLVWAGAA